MILKLKIMRPIKNVVFTKREKKENDEIKIGEETLRVDTSWSPMHWVNQRAEVYSVPEVLDSWMNTEIEVQPGDFVYTHHFINDANNAIEFEDLEIAYMPYNQLYARVRDGEIYMLNDFVLVEPVRETEDEIKTESGLYFKTNTEVKRNIGILKYVNSNTKDIGAKVGDKVCFEKDADYEMDIEGEKLFRMKNSNLIYVIEE